MTSDEREEKCEAPAAAAAAAARGRGFSRPEDLIVISLLISFFCHSSKQTERGVRGGVGGGGVGGELSNQMNRAQRRGAGGGKFYRESRGGRGLVTKAGADVGAFISSENIPVCRR